MSKKCPFCGKDIYNHPLTKYCMYCVKKLSSNICTNEDCFMCMSNTELPQDAVICPICGSNTSQHPLPF